MNSYFATAEQQMNPYLRGKPVGIVKAAGRGCIIAASIEAKKFGVGTGSTVWEAQKLCPQIVLVPSDMDKYYSLTCSMVEVVSEYSPTVEVFSIDEVFVDVTQTQNFFTGGVLEMALEMKQRISAELGEWMKCSIGIGFNRVTAKLASEMDKPNGLTILDKENYLEKTAGVKVGEVCGIGRSRTGYLYSRGAFTLGAARELADLPEDVRALVWLESTDTLVTREDLEPAKSVSRTFTTYREVHEAEEVMRLVRNLVEEAAAKLREMGMEGRTFCLMLTSGKEARQSVWVRLTVHTPSADGKIIFDLLWSRYGRYSPISVRFAGVMVGNLSFSLQPSLLFERRNELLRAADTVNQRWGLFTLYPARLLGGELIRPEVTGFLGDKWYRFGDRY